MKQNKNKMHYLISFFYLLFTFMHHRGSRHCKLKQSSVPLCMHRREISRGRGEIQVQNKWEMPGGEAVMLFMNIKKAFCEKWQRSLNYELIQENKFKFIERL